MFKMKGGLIRLEFIPTRTLQLFFRKLVVKLLLPLSFIPFQAFNQNYNAELIQQNTSITVSSGTMTKIHFFEIKINNRSGEKYTKVQIPYSKMNKISKIEAQLIDRNGKTIRRLKKNEITERSAISGYSFYQDHYVKEFTLKHNEYPYSITYTYQEKQDEFLLIGHWIPVIDEDVPTHAATLKIQIPQKYKISFDTSLVYNFKTDTTDLHIHYAWQTSYNDLVKSEIFSPPTASLLPSIIIVPEKFKFEENGWHSDWVSFGNWQTKLLHDLSELPMNEKTKITNLTQDEKSIREKVKILYHYLQDETRYINISIETGGLKPYPASYVATNKYGDCKALSNYFQSVLSFLKIKSFYTKVYAGEPTKKINKSLPSQQFNHIIICVPVQNDTIWLDCTSDGPFNYLGTFTQNRDVFVVNQNGSYFTRTPLMTKEDVCETRKVLIAPLSSFKSSATFNKKFRGRLFEYLSYVSHTLNETQKKQYIIENFIENDYELINFNLADLHRDSTYINLSYSAHSNNIYQQYGDELIIKALPFTIPKFENPESRKHAVQIDYPIYKVDTLEYKIPEGFTFKNSQDEFTINEPYGSFSLKLNLSKTKIQIIKSLLIKRGYYSLQEYLDFYTFIKKIAEKNIINLVFKKTIL